MCCDLYDTVIEIYPMNFVKSGRSGAQVRGALIRDLMQLVLFSD